MTEFTIDELSPDVASTPRDNTLAADEVEMTNIGLL